MALWSRVCHTRFSPCQYVRTWVAGDFREDAFARQRHGRIDPTVNFQLVATLHQSACAPYSCSPRGSQSTLESRSALAAGQEDADRRPLTLLFLEFKFVKARL